jgi:hypothetical protein
LDRTTALITILILLLTFAVSVGATLYARARRDSIVIRHLPAYAALPVLVSEALEADRTIHFSFGSAAPGGSTTPLILANTEAFTLLAKSAAAGAQTPLMTMSDSTALPLGYDILRRAYRQRNRIDQFRVGAVQWYPEGSRSLAFAAAVTAVMGDERPSANLLMGSFGPEVSLVLESAARRGQFAVAASDQLEGQAIAYAMSDETLIGEEMFAGAAYLGGSSAQIGSLVAMDGLRVGLVIIILLMAADRLTGGTLLEPLAVALRSALGGG